MPCEGGCCPCYSGRARTGQDQASSFPRCTRACGRHGHTVEAFALFKVFPLPGKLSRLHLLSEPCNLQALASGGAPCPSPTLCPMICDHHLSNTSYNVPGTIPRGCHSVDSNNMLLYATHTPQFSLGKYLNTGELRLRGGEWMTQVGT